MRIGKLLEIKYLKTGLEEYSGNLTRFIAGLNFCYRGRFGFYFFIRDNKIGRKSDFRVYNLKRIFL